MPLRYVATQIGRLRRANRATWTIRTRHCRAGWLRCADASRVSQADIDSRNQHELDTIRRQKIFAGCTYQQSKDLTEMAAGAKSVYLCLDTQESAARRDQLFADTDCKYYEKALLKMSDKLLLHSNLATWFSKFDTWADYLKVSQHERFVKIMTALLKEEQSDLLHHHNDGAASSERVETYQG